MHLYSQHKPLNHLSRLTSIILKTYDHKPRSTQKRFSDMSGYRLEESGVYLHIRSGIPSLTFCCGLPMRRPCILWLYLDATVERLGRISSPICPVLSRDLQYKGFVGTRSRQCSTEFHFTTTMSSHWTDSKTSSSALNLFSIYCYQ